MGRRRVEVRDRKNPDRILGDFHFAPDEWCGRIIRVPLRPRMPLGPLSPYDRIPEAEVFRFVEFQHQHIPSKDGYDLIGVFVTDAPLKDLYEVKGFYLPKMDHF